MTVFYVTSADGDRRLMSAKGFLYARPVQKFRWVTDVGEIGHPDNPARSIIGVGGGGYSEQWCVRETVDEIRAMIDGYEEDGSVAQVPEENMVGGFSGGRG